MSVAYRARFRQPVRWTCLAALALMGMLLGACAAPPPAIEVGALVLSDDFDAVGGWQTYDSGDIVVMPRSGLFRFDVPAGGYYLTTNGQPHTDIVLEVSARVLSDDRSNGYGLICRAQPDGDGYYFLVGSDGSASIRRAQGREVTALLAWTKTPAVRAGSGEANTLRAACLGQHLMLWVNGQFVGEAYDALYHRGETGLVGVTTRAGQRLTVDFSRLRGWEGR